MHATTMKTARRVVFPACRTISIALLLLAYPTFARQPQSAGSNLPRGSLTGRITVVSGEGATNNLSGVTVKLTGPAMGAVPPSTVSDADGRYEFTALATGTYTLEASADGFKPWSAKITLGADQALVKDLVLQISSVNQQVEVQGEAVRIANRRWGYRSHRRTRQLYGDSAKIIGGPFPGDYRDPSRKRAPGKVGTCALWLSSESRIGEQQQRDGNRAASGKHNSSSRFHSGCVHSPKTFSVEN